jgi:light-regulated signal transduction histidine kinase (bacteriophytochrome)
MFTKTYQNKIDTEGLEYLTMSKDSAVKMQRLIDALRQYSQYGRSHLRITNVNCSGEVERVLKIFENEINSSQAVIEVGHLPEVRADKNLLGQVFKNLISNALKYRSERLPIIKIEARRDQESWLFQIQDNGIGFSMAFSERAFKIFQRLSSGPNFSGTGIGLALCKKIIEQHGVRIWIDSVEGKGSSFYFTLPV